MRCAPGPDAAGAEKRCALLAGLEPWESEMLSHGLVRCGTVFGVRIAETAETAEMICRNGRCDPVILSGIPTAERAAALIRRLRGLQGRRRILLIVSPGLSEEEVQRCAAAGADLIVRRPYSLRMLTAAVGRLTACAPEDLGRRCLRLLTEAGLSGRTKGMRYLCQALQLLFENGLLPVKSLYREIALRENTSPENVESAVRAALQTIGRDGNVKGFLYENAEELKRNEI